MKDFQKSKNLNIFTTIIFVILYKHRNGKIQINIGNICSCKKKCKIQKILKNLIKP